MSHMQDLTDAIAYEIGESSFVRKCHDFSTEEYRGMGFESLVGIAYSDYIYFLESLSLEKLGLYPSVFLDGVIDGQSFYYNGYDAENNITVNPCGCIFGVTGIFENFASTDDVPFGWGLARVESIRTLLGYDRLDFSPIEVAVLDVRKGETATTNRILNVLHRIAVKEWERSFGEQTSFS